MPNPFDALKGKPEVPEGEDVTGAFSCQERGCYSTVTDAIFIDEIKVLTWKCENGHINKIKDFNL